jgi:putative membrane protein
MENVTVPKQNLEKIKISKKEIRTSSILSIISSSLVSFLPGVGAAQAATISSSLKKLNEKIFLVLLGMISTMTMILSFVALYAINKPRTGMAVFIGKLIPSLTINQLWTFLAIAIIAAGIAFFLSLFFAKIMGKNITKIKYKWLCLGILIFLIILTPPVSGWLALVILGVATAIGILTSLFGVKKVHMMGSLLLPVIVYYLIH